MATKPKTATAVAPESFTAASDEIKYQRKYADLKKRVREVEEENDQLVTKLARVKRNIERLKVERRFLLEKLEQTYESTKDQFENQNTSNPFLSHVSTASSSIKLANTSSFRGPASKPKASSTNEPPSINVIPPSSTSTSTTSLPIYHQSNQVTVVQSSSPASNSVNSTSQLNSEPDPSLPIEEPHDPLLESMSQSSNVNSKSSSSKKSKPKTPRAPKQLKQSKQSKQKQPKDPNAPKKPANAFFYFSNVRRNELKQQFPEMVVSDVNRQLGLEWKGMGKEDKQKYFDMYEKDKQRYAVELASYSSSANALSSSDASILGSSSTKPSLIGIDRLLASEKSEKVGNNGPDDMNEIDENDTEDDDADGDTLANPISESQSSQNSHNWRNGDEFSQSSHNIPHSSSLSNERPGLSTLPYSQQSTGQNEKDTQSYPTFAASNGSSTTPYKPLSSHATSSSFLNHGASNGEQMDVDVDVDVEGDEDDEDSDPEMF